MEKKPVRFNLKLHPELHERLRKYAFDSKRSMQDVAHTLLLDATRRVTVREEKKR